jgi:ABC-2 type transport system permease protein
VGAVARTEEAAQAMVNFVILPMAFVSGSFFAVSQMPSWLQTASLALPLRHLTDGMLDVLVRGKGPGALLVPATVLAGFALALTLVAMRVFRWDDV